MTDGEGAAPAPPLADRVGASRALGPSIRLLVLTAAALVVLVPLALLVSGALMSGNDINGGAVIPHHLSWSNFSTVWGDGQFWRYLLNSVIYLAIILPASLLTSSMAAFAFARLQFAGRNVIFGVLLSVLMFPVAALFIPVFTVLVALHLVDTRLGYILVVLSSTLPLNIFILQRFFRSIPLEIEESATLDGANVWTIFWRIGLPLVRPGLAAAAVFTFVNVWNEFLLAVIIFRTPSEMPVQQGLMEFASADRPDQQLMLAAALLSLVPVIVFYILAQRAIARGVMEGAVRG
jgi:ABC-type glycerol-3-phosphate transport system permease component